MGILGWFNVFGDSGKVIEEKSFNGKSIGVDVSYDIYRASLGMKNIRTLTDRNGVPTVLLNTLLCNVVKYKKLGLSGLIYIFDNPSPNKHKLKEQLKRKNAKKNAANKLAAANTSENKERLEKRTFVITSEMIKDVQKLLSMLGVSWIVSPVNYEAEHLGAKMTRDGIIDTFITSDSDALLFGAKSMTRRTKNKTNKKKMYEEYLLDDVLIDYDLTREQLVHLGVVLGSDFAEKTKGIGIKTVLTKGLNVQLTKEQTNAKNYFLSDVPWDTGMINNTKRDKKKLIDWLHMEKGFNKSRITKLTSIL